MLFGLVLTARQGLVTGSSLTGSLVVVVAFFRLRQLGDNSSWDHGRTPKDAGAKQEENVVSVRFSLHIEKRGGCDDYPQWSTFP
jgi:hypothetical protein